MSEANKLLVLKSDPIKVKKVMKSLVTTIHCYFKSLFLIGASTCNLFNIYI